MAAYMPGAYMPGGLYAGTAYAYLNIESGRRTFL